MKQKPATGTGGTGNVVGTGSGGNNGTGGHIVIDAGFVDLGDPTNCGNGVMDPGEKCDDANKVGGDGCTPLCQIENGWICPNWGQACMRNTVCGDGVVTSPEACDDGNKVSGDGCSADCTMVETGWQCRVPGKPCIPLCGDGVMIGSETCDDGNTNNMDGCSSTCQQEPGATCTKATAGNPSKCTVAVCGDSVVGSGEACDCGTDPTKLPSGCTGPNGLFNGDGTGCSKTCTKEPVCRSAAGKTQACATSCGNGNIEAGEDCDDGNLINGDGCSDKCKLETGFTCMTAPKSDAVSCTQSINQGENCLELPVKYRDFKNESVTSGGHPDFFYYGAAIPNPITVTSTTHGSISFKQRYCVPNSSGPARKNDATARCWDLAQAALDANGRPAFNAARTGGTTCDCQFTDWSHNGGSNNIVPGYGDATTAPRPLSGLAYVNSGNALGSPWYKGPAPVVTSATTFGQWWADGTYESDGATPNKHAIGILELGPVTGGTTANQYRFSSAPHSVWGGFFPLDPTANNFPIYTTTGSSSGPGTVKTSATTWAEPLLCNIWPYWYSSASFGGGNGCQATQYVFAPAFGPTITSDPGTWFGMNINGGNISNAQGWYHDSWFSIEARYLFAFNGAFDLQFFGDDDTFVYINGVLMIDLGGVHQRLPGKVHVNADGSATTQEGGNIYMACTNPTGQTVCPVIPAGNVVGDIVPCSGSDPVTNVKFNSTCTGTNTTCDCRTRTLTAAQTGMAPPAAGQPGNTYEIAVFSRDGHPTESNFQLTLSGFSTNQSQCGPRCGDGAKTGGEECDCGDPGVTTMAASCNGMNNADGTYNGCTTQCKYGPFCGDGTTQTDGGEQCDDGPANGVVYSATPGQGCTSTCKIADYCGDAIVDADEGEQCDLGSGNGTPGSSCTSTCQIKICLDPPCS